MRLPKDAKAPTPRMLAVHPYADGARARDAWAAVADALGVALCVVEVDGMVVAMNPAARELVGGRGAAVTLLGGRLHCADLADATRLACALRAVCTEQRAKVALRLSAPLDGPGVQVIATALGPDGPARTGDAALALLTMGTPASSLHDGPTLRSLFGLTTAEADLLLKLCAGKTPEQCAGSRNVALSTVRSQLSSLLAKTGTLNRAQLMLVVRSLPAIRAAPTTPDDGAGHRLAASRA